MSRVIAVALSLSACCLLPRAFAEEPHVALVNVTGTIRLLRQAQSQDVVSGTTLQTGDRIVSGPASAAGIVFKDGTLITVGAATEVEIRDYAFETQEAKYKFAMYLAKGSAVYSSGKIGKLAPETVRIDTPTSTVGVRGTRFIVTAE